MVKPILMPKYETQQEQGTILRWLKKEGERVRTGEALLEVETDKVVLEHESPENGVLRKILAAEGAVVPVLSVIAVLTDSPDEPFDIEQLGAASGAPGPDASLEAAASAPSPVPTVGRQPQVRSSPAAKKLAKDLGTDLATTIGTGPRGRITREDAEPTAAARRATPAAVFHADVRLCGSEGRRGGCAPTRSGAEVLYDG